MIKYPSISVVIPALNEEKNIERCLKSIFKQKYKGKLEVIVVDAGSTDETINIAKKYPVVVIKNPYVLAEAGKKVGLDKAKGKYFMVLDADMDIVGRNWFEKMIYPLEKDRNIVGSWTRFVSIESDSPLDKYITLDPIQRDPLYEFLTPSISSCVVKKNRRYTELKYSVGKILPGAFCVYRRRQILKTAIKNKKKFMELDSLVILVKNVSDRFAYVESVGIHHPFLNNMGKLIRKRRRNVEDVYFGQPDKRIWTWIDWGNSRDVVKLVGWVIYSYLFIPSLVVGIIKCVRKRTLLGLYEPVFNLVTTNVIIMAFLRNKEGRGLLKKAINVFASK